MSNTIKVTHNESLNQFEAQSGDHLSVIQYKRDGNTIIYFHTGVPEALQGQGIASQMAKHALEYARSAQLTVVPRCPYIAAYIKRHPEYQDLVQSGS